MRKHLMAVVLGLLCVTSNAQARTVLAQPSPITAPRGEAPPAETKWYGWEIMLVDLASWMSMFVEPPLGIGGMYAGAPLVHLLNGQPKRAGSSGALRIGLTAGGAMLGMALVGTQSHRNAWGVPWETVVYGTWGGVLGLGTAQIIDWIWLSKKTVIGKSHHLVPAASVTPQGVNVGVMGRF